MSRHRVVGKTDWDKVKSLTEKEIIAAAKSDPDAKPLTTTQLKKFKKVNPEVKGILLSDVERDNFLDLLENPPESSNRLKQAIQKYIRESIEKSVQKADSKKAKFIKHEKVSEWLQSWGTENEIDPPKAD